MYSLSFFKKYFRYIILFFFTVIFVLPITVGAQDVESAPLQLRKPGELGYIDWNKTKFSVGDTVWVFNADAPAYVDADVKYPGYKRDNNGYLLPYSFYWAEKGIITSIEEPMVQVAGWKNPIPCRWETIPQQRAVFYHF